MRTQAGGWVVFHGVSLLHSKLTTILQTQSIKESLLHQQTLRSSHQNYPIPSQLIPSSSFSLDLPSSHQSPSEASISLP